MDNLDAVKEVFFLKELGYNTEIIAEKLDGILYDMAVDYYTSPEAGYYIDEEQEAEIKNALEIQLEELKEKLDDYLVYKEVPFSIRNSIKDFFDTITI